MVVGTWNTTKSRENAPTSSDKFGCPCGRSPTGKCVGWHRLSDTGYVDMYAKYQKVPESERQEFLNNNKVPKEVKADFYEHMLKEKEMLDMSRKESFRQRDERKQKEKKKDVINPDSTVLFDLHNINRIESDDFDPGQE